MGSQRVTIKSTIQVESIFRFATHFVVNASKFALHGLAVAVLMGVIFGLVIGIGGAMIGIETERLTVIGGFSGWVSSFIAMMFVLSQMRRQRNASPRS